MAHSKNAKTSCCRDNLFGLVVRAQKKGEFDWSNPPLWVLSLMAPAPAYGQVWPGQSHGRAYG